MSAGALARLQRWPGALVWGAPAAHHNIGHACDGLAACAEARFARLLVEVGSDLQPAATAIRDGIATLGPQPGAIFFPRVRCRLPVPDRTDPERARQREVLTGLFLPVGADSISCVLWLSTRLPGWNPQVVFMDGPWLSLEGSDADSGGPIPDLDAAGVESLGSGAFQSRWASYMAAHIPATDRDLRREAAMRRHIRQAQRDGVTTLVVPGAAHVERMIAGLADADEPQAPSAGGDTAFDVTDARVLAVPPAAAYARFGWMQDLPFFTARFWRDALEGRYVFDRREAMLALLAEAHERSGRRLSPRQVRGILGAIGKQGALGGRTRCDLAALAGIVRAFAGEGFADFLVHDIALDYPVPGAAAIEEVDVLPAPGLGWFLFDDARDEVYLLPRPPRTTPPLPAQQVRLRQYRLRRQSPSAAETRAHERASCRIKAPPEERGSLWVNALMRRLAHRKAEQAWHSPPWRCATWIPDLTRIDWQATAQARARGEPDVYLERPAVRHPRPAVPCRYCAAVFILDPDPAAHAQSRVGGYFVDPDTRETVYSAFYWFGERHRLGAVTESRICLQVRLLPDVVPSAAPERVRALLATVAPAERCGTPPWQDRELYSRFAPGGALALGAALRWTRSDHVVLVAAEPGVWLTQDVLAYARERSKRIITLPSAAFPPLVLDRYALDSELPARGPFSGPLPGTERFVRPLYGYPANLEGTPSDAMEGGDPGENTPHVG